MFTIRLLKKFFRSSYLHLFTSNLLLLPLVKYSPVTFFGKFIGMISRHHLSVWYPRSAYSCPRVHCSRVWLGLPRKAQLAQRKQDERYMECKNALSCESATITRVSGACFQKNTSVSVMVRHPTSWSDWVRNTG